MKTTRRFVIICFFILITGCVTTLPITEAGNGNLTVNISSKKDTFSLYGQPHDVIPVTDTNEDQWVYAKGKIYTSPLSFIPYFGFIVGGGHADIDIIKISFNKDNGTLVRIEKTEYNNYMNVLVTLAQYTNTSHNFERVKIEMEKLTLPFDEKIANEFKGMDNVLEY